MKWETLSTESLVSHPPYFIARKDVCKKPDGGIIPAYYVVELPVSILVFGQIDEESVVMVEQYRYPVNQISIELPGGFVEEGESLQEAAKREMLEETGYVFSEYIFIGKLAGNPGILNNFTHIFLAKDNPKKYSQQLDQSEEIKVNTYSFQYLAELIKENKIIQSLHIGACFYVLMYLNKLHLLEST